MKKDRKMDATKIFTIILLQITFAGFVYSKSTCLTWKVEDKTLILIFRTENFSEPLTFIDTAGKDLAGCNFKLDLPECYSRHPYGNITADILQKKIVFSFDKIVNNDTYVNGLWTCLQGNDKYFTRVSTKEGIITSTDLKLYGKIIDSKAIELTCSSCREPHGNYIEFLIDDQSFTSVSFSKDTNQCKHGRIACRPGVCSCSLSGNTFTFTFSLVNNTNAKLFSCEMRFVDRLYNSRFLKVTTVYYNGTHLISKGTKTNVTKPASPSETISEVDTSTSGNGSIITTEADVVRSDNSNVSEITINWNIVAAVLVFTGFLLIVVICLLYKRNLDKQRQNRTDNGKVSTDQEKETLLIGTVSTDKEKETVLIERKTDDVPVEQVEVSTYGEYNCSPCSRIRMVPAATWCMDCGESLCPECAHCHQGMIISHGHTLVDIKQVPADYIISNGIYCTEHSYSKYENYCHDEDQLCCVLCVQTKHHSCSKLVSISELSENIEDILETNSLNMAKISYDLDVLKDAYTQHKIQIEYDAHQIERSLSRIVEEANQESVVDEKMMAYIEQSARSQNEQLHKAKMLSIEKNSEIINSIDKMMNSLSLQTKCIDFVRKNGSSKLVYLYISSTSKKILNQMMKITREGAPRLQFDRPMRKSSLSVGTINIYNEQLLDSTLKPKEQNQSQVPVTIENNARSFSNIF